jgi:hypothetical protein
LVILPLARFLFAGAVVQLWLAIPLSKSFKGFLSPYAVLFLWIKTLVRSVSQSGSLSFLSTNELRSKVRPDSIKLFCRHAEQHSS